MDGLLTWGRLLGGAGKAPLVEGSTQVQMSRKTPALLTHLLAMLTDHGIEALETRPPLRGRAEGRIYLSAPAPPRQAAGVLELAMTARRY